MCTPFARGFGFRVSILRFRVQGSSFGFRVSGFGFRVLCLGFRIQGFVFRISCFGFRVLCFWCSGSGFCASGFVFRVQAFVFCVACFFGAEGAYKCDEVLGGAPQRPHLARFERLGPPSDERIVLHRAVGESANARQSLPSDLPQ